MFLIKDLHSDFDQMQVCFFYLCAYVRREKVCAFTVWPYGDEAPYVDRDR